MKKRWGEVKFKIATTKPASLPKLNSPRHAEQEKTAAQISELPFSVNEGARHRGACATDLNRACGSDFRHSLDAPLAGLAANATRVLTLKMYNSRFK